MLLCETLETDKISFWVQSQIGHSITVLWMGPSMECLTMQGSPEEGPRDGASSGDSPPRAREVLL